MHFFFCSLPPQPDCIILLLSSMVNSMLENWMASMIFVSWLCNSINTFREKNKKKGREKNRESGQGYWER